MNRYEKEYAMRQVPKFFNTAGPIQPDIHYQVEPLSRINLEEIEQLIDYRKYFILHAPRQTGKTSCLLALRDYLNARGEFIAVYANVEAGQAMRNQVDEVVKATAGTIAAEARLILKSELPNDVLRKVVRDENTTGSNMLTTFLTALCEALDRPLVLFIDEIDALVGDSLVSVLRQIRAGYANRPAHFPQTIILCGIRDVRDYRIVLSNQDIVTGGSAFNIKAESLHLGNFSKEEIRELYMQHTAAT
ncbi:MAG: AAA family ATPase, partial [Bacteroides sp.]